MNIYEKMLNITNEMSNVNKNLIVGEGKNSYKAVGEADILKAVKELEFKHRVYSYPHSREIIDSTMYTTSNKFGEKNNIFSRIKTIYRFVNIDKPEEYIETTTYAEGIDTQDKGAGKAMTYADKYALMKAYKIVTGEDPDQNKSVEGIKKTTEDEKEVSNTLVTTKEVDLLKKLLKGKTEQDTIKNLEIMVKKYGKEKAEDLLMTEYVDMIHKINEIKKKQKETIKEVI